MPAMAISYVQACVLTLCVAAADQQLLMQVKHMSPEGRAKSGPVWPWPISPSWLYLLLPLIMSTIYIRMKYDLHQYARRRQPCHSSTTTSSSGAGAGPEAPHGLALIDLKDVTRRLHDPELEAIAHWLGRDLSVEEWGHVPLSRMTERQLQALGFAPGCPVLSSPRFKGKSPHEIGKILGVSEHLVDAHAESQKMPAICDNAIRWSDPSRFEEITD